MKMSVKKSKDKTIIVNPSGIFTISEVFTMTAKEYLQQGYRIDQRINSKIAQVTTLRELATKATATLSDMPGNATPNTHRMEDIIVKMIDLENEINTDIDSLVDLKAEMVSVIKGVRPPTWRPVHRPKRFPAAWYSRIFSTFSAGSLRSSSAR